MKFKPFAKLACPLDGSALSQQENRFVCVDGHSFDVARQGYLNLLPVQHKKSAAPGDSKAMIEARSRFLDAGVYAPVAQRLFEVLRSNWSAAGSVSVLDAGCGEGYYPDFLRAELLKVGCAAELIGLDISKPAIVAATKRSRDITWLVGSNKQPPLLPGSVDVILCMFGFPVYDTFKRILKPGGKLILVEAGEEHLIELRRVIYAQLKQRGLPSLEEAERCGFELLDQNRLCYRYEALSQTQIADLLLMTPHLFRADHAGKQRAAQLEEIDISVDVSFRVLGLPS